MFIRLVGWLVGFLFLKITLPCSIEALVARISDLNALHHLKYNFANLFCDGSDVALVFVLLLLLDGLHREILALKI